MQCIATEEKHTQTHTHTHARAAQQHTITDTEAAQCGWQFLGAAELRPTQQLRKSKGGVAFVLCCVVLCCVIGAGLLHLVHTLQHLQAQLVLVLELPAHHQPQPTTKRKLLRVSNHHCIAYTGEQATHMRWRAEHD